MDKSRASLSLGATENRFGKARATHMSAATAIVCRPPHLVLRALERLDEFGKPDRIVEHYFFGSLSSEQNPEILNVSRCGTDGSNVQV